MSQPQKLRKRKFRLWYEGWEATVVIDEEKAEKDIKESVEFWTGWVRQVSSFKGDYTRAFIENIAPILLTTSQDNDLDWLRNKHFNNLEGYCFPFDGSRGIDLVACDEWNFFEESISVHESTEVPNG